MKKFLLSAFLAIICVTTVYHVPSAQALELEEIWHKYAPLTDISSDAARKQTPGRILGAPQGRDTASFDYHWKYRWRTYELHFAEPALLARSIYGLALHAGDVSPKLPKEKVYNGVLGFHYSLNQVCAWLNDVAAKRQTLTPEENWLVGVLLQDGVIAIHKGGFGSTGKIRHILAAAPGKKRSFAANLRHERLHVFWDENSAFRAREMDSWKTMTEVERAEARNVLKNYAQNNESQLIEEWAVKRAEASNMQLE